MDREHHKRLWTESIMRDYGQTASRETMDREHHERLWTESITKDYGQTASRETMDREHHERLRHSHYTARTINPPVRAGYLIAFTVQQHGLPTHGAAIGSLAVFRPQ